ncbi:hypothetical protein KFL_000270350 [Klebsormidium nitens]|uniref:IC97/Casc1 N-terminal domain-containing protein n=1 Tax=Klebsormidium nitens TaxID=105231 RepID=A0A1Y1HRS3_KLENI|nr:hypothetical protein KFL_000270350 [Klebsormidium nitens]|eukprot:GAQ79276.1 hypothetical protein KFL_000270350 [Klebsormidium nitens]
MNFAVQPPKKNDPNSPKKKSKKEREAEKKAEQERLAEEERLAEIERLRLEEEERQRKAEEDLLAREAEAARLAVEAERIGKEREGLEGLWKRREHNLETLERKAREVAEWERYLACSSLPDPRKEAEVNEYIAEISKHPDEETDLQSALRSCGEIEKVIADAEICQLEARERGEDGHVARYESDISRLRGLGSARLDRATSESLQSSYAEFAASGEATCTASSDSSKLAIWVNHARNPRARTFDFPAVGFTMELPKPLALANVAVRLLQKEADPGLRSRNEFSNLASNRIAFCTRDAFDGGTFSIDVLAVPPAPKQVKGWTLKHVTPLSTSVSRLPYPLVTPGGDMSGTMATAPPMGVSLVLAHNVVPSGTAVQVGWWDQEEQCWQTDGVSEVSYDGATRRLSFQTTKLKTLAVLQDRLRLFPYQSWTVRPTSEASAVLTLQTASLVVEIEIGDGTCRWVSPNLPEVSDLVGVAMRPRELLCRASRRGIHLAPEDGEALLMGREVKDPLVESSLCADMAPFAVACTLGSSRWNSAPGPQACVLRLLEVNEYKFPFNIDKSQDVRTILHRAKGNALLTDLDERSPEFREGPPSEVEYHASLLVTLRSHLSEDAVRRVEKGAPLFTKTVERLCTAMRLLSFAQ